MDKPKDETSSSSKAPTPAPPASQPRKDEHLSANAEPVGKYDLPSDEAIEKLDRYEALRKLSELGIAVDESAHTDAIRATLRRAPELIAEREAMLAAEQGVEPKDAEGVVPDPGK
jgi:hypothetical protein